MPPGAVLAMLPGVVVASPVVVVNGFSVVVVSPGLVDGVMLPGVVVKGL